MYIIQIAWWQRRVNRWLLAGRGSLSPLPAFTPSPFKMEKATVGSVNRKNRKKISEFTNDSRTTHPIHADLNGLYYKTLDA
jgi:hypothetical protein